MNALDPSLSSVVEACAGSGKTWLLVSRMIRLLLAGAAPSELLAITFTRKAAEEMRARLFQWLEALATLPDEAALAFLVERGLEPSEAERMLPRARGLFEAVLHSQPGPMITTFHGWFLNLLSRAPLTCRAPANLIEDVALLADEAWLTWAESLRQPEHAAEAEALRALLAELPLDSVRALLSGFQSKRAEWWAWAEGRAAPLAEAVVEFAALTGVDETADSVAEMLAEPGFLPMLEEFAPLLARNGAETKLDAERSLALNSVVAVLSVVPAQAGTQIVDSAGFPPVRERQCELSIRPEIVLTLACPLPQPLPLGGRGAWQRGRGRASISIGPESIIPSDEILSQLQSAFLTGKGEPVSRKVGPTLDKRLGPADAARFVELHYQLAERIVAALRRQQNRRALRLDRLALTAGLGLVERYQALKRERDGLDFTDAEWLALRLLSDPEESAALLAKLDARWKHLLLDEFQDANPLQWRILTAWLAAYGADTDRPTVFMVGDPKQSIYRFRRAEPRLFGMAGRWLEENFAAVTLHQNETRRCAPRVVAWVNALFGAQGDAYAGFEAHAAHRRDLPGWCELLVAPAAAPSTEREAGLRDPLTEAPPARPDKRAPEAAAVANRIKELVGRLQVAEAGGRPARFEDILVLSASRTGLDVFESAFKAAGIPYLSSRRGGLLETLEASDLLALLGFLVMPHDDLKLAQALKSPLFGFGDDDLVLLRDAGAGPWSDRLRRLARRAEAPEVVRRAAGLLDGWREVAGRLPPHDLLDRIFHEGEVEARYAAAVPARLRPSVLANLRGLLEQSLSLGSGRFPSLPRFLDDLHALRDTGDEAPDEPPAAAGDVVRMLTIHAAKGLEAPIVFLIKADEERRNRDHYGAVIDWPPEAERPVHFSLYGPGALRGHAREALFEQERAQEAREQLNLLYVAMTRARQALIVSGLEEAKEGTWLTLLAAGLEDADMAGLPEMMFTPPSVGEDGIAAALPVSDPASKGLNSRPLTPSPSPSRGEGRVSVGRRRAQAAPEAEFGVRVHRYLELHTAAGDINAIRRDLGLDEAGFAEVGAAAERILAAPDLRRFFTEGRARNELEFVDTDGRLRRIDRLVEFDDEVWVLDYKTGGPDPAYEAQLADYRMAAQSFYPGKRVRAALVFTDGGMLEL